jgi:hypothetical protein
MKNKIPERTSISLSGEVASKIKVLKGVFEESESQIFIRGIDLLYETLGIEEKEKNKQKETSDRKIQPIIYRGGRGDDIYNDPDKNDLRGNLKIRRSKFKKFDRSD